MTFKFRNPVATVIAIVREFRKVAAEVASTERMVNHFADLLVARRKDDAMNEVKQYPERIIYLGELLIRGTSYVSIYAAEVLMRLNAEGVDVSHALPFIRRAHSDLRVHPTARAYLGAAIRGQLLVSGNPTLSVQRDGSTVPTFPPEILGAGTKTPE